MKVRPLIKIKAEVADPMGRPHSHKKFPVTRRDFLGRGLIAGASYIALPSVFGLLSMRKALGAFDCKNISTGLGLYGSVNPISFMAYDCGGGIGFSNIFIPKDSKSGNYMGTSTRLGFSTNSTGGGQTAGLAVDINDNNRIKPQPLPGIGNTPPPGGYSYDDNLIKGLRIRCGDSFYSTLVGSFHQVIANRNDATAEIPQAIVDEALKRTRGAILYCQGNDDSSENPLNPLPKIRDLSSGILMGESINRGKSKEMGASNLYATLTANSISDLQGSVQISDNLFKSESRMDLLKNAVTSLSTSEERAVANIPTGPDLVKKLGLRLKDMQLYGADCLASLFDPRDPADATRLFKPIDIAAQTGLQITGINNNNSFPYAVINAVANRFSCGSVVTRGGYDYHGNGSTAAQDKHREVAIFVKRWLAVHMITNTLKTSYPTSAEKAMLAIYTDGGIGWNTDMVTQNLFDPANDRGNMTMVILLFFDFSNPVAPSGTTRDLGGVTASETSDNTALVASTPTNPAASMVANYAKLSELAGNANAMAECRRILGEPPFRLTANQVDQLICFV